MQPASIVQFLLYLMRAARTFILGVCLMAGSFSLAHATLVLGTVASRPEPPRPAAPFTLTVSLRDLTQIPDEGARVRAEFYRPGQNTPIGTRLTERDTPGVYSASVTLPAAGSYTLLLRDQTYRQEEAQASLTFPVGQTLIEPLEFVFPPTATGGGVWTWIGWLLGVPLLVASVTTALVWLGGAEESGRGTTSYRPSVGSSLRVTLSIPATAASRHLLC